MKLLSLAFLWISAPVFAAGHLGIYTGFTYSSEEDCVKAAQTAALKIGSGTRGQLNVLEAYCTNFQVHVTYVTALEKSIAEKQIVLTHSLPALNRLRSRPEDLSAFFSEIVKEFESKEFHVVEAGETELNGKTETRVHVIDRRDVSAREKPMLYMGITYTSDGCKIKLNEMMSATAATFGKAAGYCLRLTNAEGFARPAVFTVY